MVPRSPTIKKLPFTATILFKVLKVPGCPISQVKVSRDVKIRFPIGSKPTRPPPYLVKSPFGRAAKIPFPNAIAPISYSETGSRFFHFLPPAETRTVPRSPTATKRPSPEVIARSVLVVPESEADQTKPLRDDKTLPLSPTATNRPE